MACSYSVRAMNGIVFAKVGGAISIPSAAAKSGGRDFDTFSIVNGLATLDTRSIIAIVRPQGVLHVNPLDPRSDIQAACGTRRCAQYHGRGTRHPGLERSCGNDSRSPIAWGLATAIRRLDERGQQSRRALSAWFSTRRQPREHIRGVRGMTILLVSPRSQAPLGNAAF
jgi:hypothetical protein